ncbi:MAG: aminomethyl-transferring glycine dehydrogenase [Casimicrobiaceae bacterium]
MSDFIARHIGPSREERMEMLAAVGASSLDDLLAKVVPADIVGQPLDLPAGINEVAALTELREIANRNLIYKSFIGQGYYGTITPKVILRNVLENPAWYTAYTPYQAEISQGRLEALINFQTMVCDLTGMEIANASLLDEATAAAEAVALARRQARSESKVLIVAGDCHPQTIEVVRTRAEPLGSEVRVGFVPKLMQEGDYFAVLAQYPSTSGQIHDMAPYAELAHEQGALFICAADPLALTLLKPPGEWGADIVVGSTQRFGVPMGFGGPHAAFLATRDAYKRNLPGRLVGVSVDAQGRPAYRLTLQTREQHIRREKATSNICTAQVLLAVVASMYAVYHGPKGLRAIAERIHGLARRFNAGLRSMGLRPLNEHFFDTVTFISEAHHQAINTHAGYARMNVRHYREWSAIGVAFDETHTDEDVDRLLRAIADAMGTTLPPFTAPAETAIPVALRRTSAYLTHPVFNRHHSETEMLRYLRKLADRDLALDRTMIPLGSCTMKLNATTEIIPVTWPEFSDIHPFAPEEQVSGYLDLIGRLEGMLAKVTGFDAVSLQPNSGAQGEFAGLLAIRAYHRARGEEARNVCLIPSSAHGTNPASAQMCGMEVVVTPCDAQGNIDVAALRALAEQHASRLAALMITYPSTHGVFEAAIKEICAIVHAHGGLVYMDGANLNAQVGVTSPAALGADVAHLNLHKTFCIPHGGGGPGVGPIGVKAHLAPYLPGRGSVGPVSAARYGSASILPIPFAYIRMMGGSGLREATAVAILNANYVAQRLAPHYPVLYTGPGGFVAHECIIDLRPIKEASGVSNMDVAKRLIDYGFHAPTVSFPVPGTLMIEPTESEDRAELDRFIEAMVAIREEIRAIETGVWPKDDNPLVNAPHTAEMLLAESWNHAYSREQAAYPLPGLRQNKYWPPVGRVDDVYGDRNIMSSCPPVDAFSPA